MSTDTGPLEAACRIVGIGASAGGLESLEQLFTELPRAPGMAFVVVQHLSPDFRSVMDELIRRHSEMPVVLAESGMEVVADHIYLMPPGKEMIIRDRRLVLTDKEPHAFSLPIDGFFRSLAQDVGTHAVAVVLSGSGSDGSRGIVDVHRAGGLVLAESALTAKFDGMPLSAAGTGIVDHVLPPRDIARLLCGLPPRDVPAEDAAMSDDPVLDAVLRLLRETFGIDFSLYKMTTVGRRIQRRVELLRFGGLAQYAELLAADPDELNKLYHDLLIGVTQFFRDPDAFAILEQDVIPRLLDHVKLDEDLRIWVAGCATGEEAYSLAMLFWEAFQARERPVRLRILATDVHQRSLDFASAGIYGDEQLAHLGPERVQRFFTRRPSGYQISQDLRQLIVFARHNLTKDAPFTKMHFISCRNMLIYLQPQAQRTVLSLFHFGLAPNGILLLGASETPGSLADEFTTIDDRWKLFRKRRDVQLPGQLHMPVVQPARKALLSLPTPRHGPDPLVLATYDQLLDLFMPPGFLIDEDRTLVDSFAGAEKLLRPRPRRPSTNILDLLDDELRTVVAGAIQRAAKENTAVSYAGVRVPTDDGERRCTIAAQPLVHPRTGARHVLVTFRDLATEQAPAEPAGAAIPVAEASRERVGALETELAYTRETLQATIEELETSNEELQATNEELVASNEELQSTNEELHSVNEELYTVNAEYHQKITELKELNADMTHLLEGTDVGTVFLDDQLRIRRFTSRIAGVFRFQPHDLGRHIGDFSHNIERPQLLDDIEAARRDGIVVEDEVRDHSHTPFFLRILPYRGGARAGGNGFAHATIDGVVLTLTDLTALDRARTRVAQLSAIVEATEDAIFSQSLDGTITTWNHGAEVLFGYGADEILCRSVRILMEPGTGHLAEHYLREIEAGRDLEPVSAFRRNKSGERLDVLTRLSPIPGQGGVVGVAAIARDVSRLVQTQRALEAEQRRVELLLAQAEDASRMRDRFLAMLSHELRNPLAAVLNASAALRETGSPQIAEQTQAVIARQAHQMKRLLDDILDVSRITTDKFIVRRDAIDLRDSIETAIESTAPLYAERGVTLSVDVPSRELPIRGDAGRLGQLIGNLLSNAANYSPAGTRVDLRVTTNRGYVDLRVIDRGAGIEPALQKRIFELFVQSEQQLDRPRGGLGVGLSLAKNIAELHDGAIGVESEGLGRGSVFTVTLPLDRGVRARAPSEGQPPGPRTIVLVDDQDDSRDMLRVLFEARRHTVYDGSDGRTALALIEQHKPDVAFIDIGLPVMNGFEVAQQVRRQPDLDAVVLVALTGYGGHADVDAARAAGFDEHVTKPAELAQLEQILARSRPDQADDA